MKKRSNTSHHHAREVVAACIDRLPMLYEDCHCSQAHKQREEIDAALQAAQKKQLPAPPDYSDSVAQYINKLANLSSYNVKQSQACEGCGKINYYLDPYKTNLSRDDYESYLLSLGWMEIPQTKWLCPDCFSPYTTSDWLDWL
jgi:hypothetical protein